MKFPKKFTAKAYNGNLMHTDIHQKSWVADTSKAKREHWFPVTGRDSLAYLEWWFDYKC